MPEHSNPKRVRHMLFQDCICFRLGAASRKITRYYKDRIAPFGLTHGQFFLLVALYDEDQLLPSQLAEKTALDRPTTSGLLDRLEKAGWIERSIDPDDRRTVRVRLTAKALEQREAILSIFEEINGRFLDQFSPGEWESFNSVLRKLENYDA